MGSLISDQQPPDPSAQGSVMEPLNGRLTDYQPQKDGDSPEPRNKMGGLRWLLTGAPNPGAGL